MKLHFESDLDYQLQAIEAVCDIFRGQEISRSEFTVMHRPAGQDMFGVRETDLGIGNRLNLLDDELLKNVREIQLRNGIKQSDSLKTGDFTVEMETGTGKTYVYLRTIFELNKRYGFTKFIIVVPSVAIREGVYKTLQITEDHFASLYANQPVEFDVYDSSKLSQVRNFATSSLIQILVITVGAINKKDVNNLYKDSEKTGGEKPIDLIRATQPVLIVDEPQSVDGGLEGRGREALAAMNPLCTLRYSATHVDKHHMVYRLDAVDAYERKLVKQIEVASATVDDAYNKPFVRLVELGHYRKNPRAKIEIHAQGASGIQPKEVWVYGLEDLEQEARREIYANCTIGEISLRKGNEFLQLLVPGGEHYLKAGEVYGSVRTPSLHRELIKRTIREHLDKEKRLRDHGIKVLSLFFIDKVENYRQYDEEGNPVKGPYAIAFEEEYRKFMNYPDYATLFTEIDRKHEPEELHGGYFSIDRKKIGGKPVEMYKDTKGTTQADDSTYNLIMKDKEKLLSLDTPLKFIFSHSALREGWDNPNVFQICTLRDIRTERERRQTVGRGLRICVNQSGERVRGFDYNILTVVATESYQEFAENLQKEIEQDTHIKFGIVERHQFALVTVVQPDGTFQPLGEKKSEEVWKHLQEQGYLDKHGTVQDKLRTALKEDKFTVPDEFENQRAEIGVVLNRSAGRLEIKNADAKKQIRVRGERLNSPEFKELWDRIKHKTTYRVNFDNEKLLKDCVDGLRCGPPILKSRLVWRKADIAIGEGGVDATQQKSGGQVVVLEEENIPLPDLLTELQNRTELTRKSIYRIVTESERLGDFKKNPQQYIEIAGNVINKCKRLALVDGIKYKQLGDGDIFAQELFHSEELMGYLDKAVKSEKSVYEYVVWDSGIEQKFAQDLESNPAVKVYAKLPDWFKVPTPLGTYNPDWAIVVSEDGADRLYFVVETKSSLFAGDLRATETAKIECGKAHFDAISIRESPARYEKVTTVEDLLAL